MRKRDAEKFKKMLVLEKQSILQHLNELETESESQLETTGGDSVDLASLEITQAAIQKLGTREKKLLKKIDLALDKIENGEYGICETCGEPIAPKRLEARPVAQFCIDCKTEQEQNERRFSDEEQEDDESGEWTADDAEESGS